MSLWIRCAVLLSVLGLPTLASADEYEEITIYGDLFARWDNTRWFIKTEVGLPVPLTLAADENFEFRTYSFQVRTVLACSKQWRLGNKRYEVDCEMEDFSIRAVVYDRNPRPRSEKVQALLTTIDKRLTGAKMQLQVSNDGRVTNIDLEGVEKGKRRTNQMHETLRMIMARVIAGFDMKLRKHNNLNEGQWVEYNPALMSIPTPDFVTSRGSSMLIHQLNKYQGHRVVQSVGRGMITIGDGQTESNYDVDFNGVSIYDHDEGYMTERVWALHGNATASSYLAEGKAARPYWHAGRVVMLDPDEKPNVGRSVPVAAPGQPPWEGEEAWWVLEDD